MITDRIGLHSVLLPILISLGSELQQIFPALCFRQSKGRWKNWTFFTLWKFFQEYFQTISRIIPYHGKHSMELDKTMATGFSNLNISKNRKSKMEIFPKFPILPCYGRGPIFESTQRACILKYVLLR